MRTTLVSLATAFLLPAAGASSVPEPVSPGAPQTATGVSTVCPTFSWGAVENPEAYEIVVWDWTNGETGKEASLRETVSGKALSWTPPVEKCLAHGGRYGWSIRELDENGEGTWSEVRLFVVSPRPLEDEIYRALEVLRRAGFDGIGSSGEPAIAQPGMPGDAGSVALAPPDPAAPLPGAADLAISDNGTVFGNAFVFSCGEEATSQYFLDADEDTYGDPANAARACTAPSGYVANSADCDDQRANRNLACVCDPYDPTAECGPDATRCTPSTTDNGICRDDPVGSGTQGNVCFDDSDCAFDYVCEVFSATCARLCRVLLGPSDCPVFTTCFGTTPTSSIGGLEWGVCFDF